MNLSVSGKDIPGGTPGASEKGVTVRCWGVRGSLPDPGPHSARYGGNTSCVEVRAGDQRIILDAGTGIRRLGEDLREKGHEKEAVIFLTHFHWDHIQGLPFFAPAYDSGFTLRLFGPREQGRGIEELLATQMGPPHFPVAQRELPASTSYSDELGPGSPHAPVGWKEGFDQFVQGADVLLHDAMFTETERPGFKGWGHSTFRQVVDLALRTGVRNAFFFHHAPGRSDEELDDLLGRFREEVAGRGADLKLHAAVEGLDIVL